MPQSPNRERRRYDNRLRAEQANSTRERILEAAAAVMAAGEMSEFSVGKVAKQAGVSEPTVYRHFGSRDGLIDAFGPWFGARHNAPDFPDSAEEFSDVAPQLFAFFEANETYIRAATTYANNELVTRGRAQRRARSAAALQPHVRHLPPERAAAMVAVFHQLLGSRSWISMRDEHAVSTADAGQAVQWVMQTVLEGLRRQAEQAQPTAERTS